MIMNPSRASVSQESDALLPVSSAVQHLDKHDKYAAQKILRHRRVKRVAVVLCVGLLCFSLDLRAWASNLYFRPAPIASHFLPENEANLGTLLPAWREENEAYRRSNTCTRDRLTLVLPLHPRDLNSFYMLWASLCAFLRFEDVHTFYVVVPSQHKAEMVSMLRNKVAVEQFFDMVTNDDSVDAWLAGAVSVSEMKTGSESAAVSSPEALSSSSPPSSSSSVPTPSSKSSSLRGAVACGPEHAWGRGHMVVVSDERLLPSVATFPWNLPLLNRLHGPGWRRQQLAKLAIARYVYTQFYMTLDADLLLTQRTTAARLLPDGRALTNMEPTSQHASWWAASQHILGSPVLRDEEEGMGVTPAVLHTNSVLSLCAYVEEHQGVPHWAEFLSANLRFTEYTLYSSFVMAQKLFSRFHRVSHNAVYQGHNVWFARDLRPFFGVHETEDVRPSSDDITLQMKQSPAFGLFCRNFETKTTSLDVDGVKAGGGAPAQDRREFDDTGPFMILNDHAIESFNIRDVWSWLRPYLDPERRRRVCLGVPLDSTTTPSTRQSPDIIAEPGNANTALLPPPKMKAKRRGPKMKMKKTCFLRINRLFD